MNSYNEAMERALTRAREWQQQMNEAANSAAEQLKPQVQKSLDGARELQTLFSKNAETATELAARQAQTAIGLLGDFMRLGAEAMRESNEQARVAARQMVEQSRKVVEAAAAASGRRDEP